MTNEQIRDIKKIALVAMFADDVLMEKLVLKGGNLLDLVYGLSVRASVDLDLSIDGDFDEGIEELSDRIEKSVTRVFGEHNYKVIDLKLRKAPPKITADRASFWGGYKLEFKVVDEAKFDPEKSIEATRKLAIPIVEGGSTKIKIDLSRHEYCENKEAYDGFDYTIFIYPPETFVCEKIRAICQQMPEYSEEMGSNPSARARDFIDIYLVADKKGVSFESPENQQLIGDVFAAKKVPLSLIADIEDHREFHRDDFISVRDTMKAGEKLETFDHYFDCVVKLCEPLKPLRNE